MENILEQGETNCRKDNKNLKNKFFFKKGC